MPGNPAPNPPAGPYSGNAYERFRRWYAAHVLRRFPGTKRQRIVRLARASLHFHGRMVYTEGPQRGQLFHRKRGKFKGAHADCSQYAASLCHWAGVKDVTDTDWTGTLGKKGTRVTEAKPGVFVFFGLPPYVHMAVMIDRRRCIGFGQQSAPDENTLGVLLDYFAAKGHRGFTYIDLTR